MKRWTACKRTLGEEMLVIADEKGPIAVAGVMGGEFSGVYDDTTTIVFESAMFYGPSVRTTAKKLGMRTEAAGRYEKGLDPNGCLPLPGPRAGAGAASGRGRRGERRGGRLAPQARRAPHPPAAPRPVNRLLGTQLSREEMVAILLPLGFEMDGDDVIVPSSRWDVERDCDLAEEVARFVGYNKMPSTIMQGVASARPHQRQTFRETC